MKITVNRPHSSERNEIYTLIDTVIRDTMIRDGVDAKADFIEEEVRRQQGCLDADFRSTGSEVFYLVARTKEDRIVGTIALVPANSVICTNLEFDSTTTPEIGNVLVHPEYHGCGVGAAMFRAIIDQLNEKQLAEFVLDCGYQVSQGYWKKHLGEPDVFLRDFYGRGIGHMIWKRQVAATGIAF